MRQAGVVIQALGVLLGRALLAAGLCLSPGSASGVDDARLLGAHHDHDIWARLRQPALQRPEPD